MYLTHFGLTGYPFERDLQPDELFACARLREAQARLSHLVELRGIGLITGEVGSAKTTACRHFSAGLHAGLYRLLYVSLSTGNVMDRYKSIACALGLPVERAMAFRSLQSEITRLATAMRQQPILVVDEAHHLRNEVLEDLRLLTHYAMDAERRLCLVLVGLTALRRRLAMAVHESLEQRIVVSDHCGGLARDEVPADLSERLQRAGSPLPLFEPPAIEALFQASHGLPRKLNRAAHYALSAAALTKARQVSAEHVQTALDEFRP